MPETSDQDLTVQDMEKEKGVEFLRDELRKFNLEIDPQALTIEALSNPEGKLTYTISRASSLVLEEILGCLRKSEIFQYRPQRDDWQTLKKIIVELKADVLVQQDENSTVPSASVDERASAVQTGVEKIMK